jgi:hypothetical protein
MKNKYTQEQMVVKWVEYNHPNEVPSYKMQMIETPFGFLGTDGNRAARRMVAAGQIRSEVRARVNFEGNKISTAYYRLPESQQLELFDSLRGNQDVVGHPTKYGSYNI